MSRHLFILIDSVSVWHASCNNRLTDDPDYEKSSTIRAIFTPLHHILHGHLAGSPDVAQERLKSKYQSVPFLQKLLNDLFELGFPRSSVTNYRRSTEYSKSSSIFHVFFPKASVKPIGMSLPGTSWVKINRLMTGVKRFQSSMFKWGLAPWSNCKCSTTEQIADHVTSACPMHRLA